MVALIEPQIIYADDQLLILDKPAGWLTHLATPVGVNPSAPAITDWLLANHPLLAAIGPAERLQDGTTVLRAGILHRLDRETSGILAVAQTAPAFAWFTRAFRERTVEKIYRAIVVGVVKPDDGMIDWPIGRSRQDPRRRVASQKAAGVLRAAVTYFQVLERFAHHTYLELKPKTGRTHQLRVHLKALQHPILGDDLYAPQAPKLSTIARLALHAFALTVPYPQGARRRFAAPLPADFQLTLDYLRES